MHYTHCIKQGPHFMYHITIELDLSLHSAVHDQQIRRRGVRTSEKMWWETGSIEGKTQKERTRQRALCTWIRVFPDAAVCCFGLWGWKPGVAPTAEVHSGHQSLYLGNAVEVLPTIQVCVLSHPLICLVHLPPRMEAVAAEIFLKWCWCKCLQRHQLTLCFPPPLIHSDCRDGAGGSEKQDQSCCLHRVLVSLLQNWIWWKWGNVLLLL